MAHPTQPAARPAFCSLSAVIMFVLVLLLSAIGTKAQYNSLSARWTTIAAGEGSVDTAFAQLAIAGTPLRIPAGTKVDIVNAEISFDECGGSTIA